MLLATFFAALPDPSSAMAVGFVALTLFGIFAGLNSLMGFFEKLRAFREPSPGQISVDRVVALEKRIHNIELKMENHMGAMSNQFKSISETLTNLQSDWSYAIGRIDGRHESNH